MMRQLRHVNIDATAMPPRVPFSHAVADGQYAFLAGRLAADAIDRKVTSADIEEETRVAMELLGKVLRRLGLDFGDVVRVNVYMTDLRELDRMNAVYSTYFDPERPPARTCVGVAQLIGGGRVEIDCIARFRP